jgi:superfamily II DNA or RNA helicase
VNDKIIIEKLNAVYFKIHCNFEQLLELRDFFTTHAENYWFSPKYKAKMWDGKISFFNTNDNTLPIGLFKFLHCFLKLHKYNYELKFKEDEFFNHITHEDLNKLFVALFKNKEFYPRDYQIDSVFKFLNKKRGVVELPTGSGKSNIIYVLIRYLLASVDKKILLVVPNINLTLQMFSDFKEYGFEEISDYVSVLFHDSKMYDKNKRILISTWQSIYKKQYNFFEEFDAVIVDEVQSVTDSSKLKQLLQKCINADYRFGLTGTLPENLSPINLFNIFGFLGPKLIIKTDDNVEVKTKTLQDQGYLSKIKIANLIIKYPKEDIQNLIKLTKQPKKDSDEPKKNVYAEEIKYIINHKKRNNVIKYILKHINTNDNVLILCQRIEHLDFIYDYLKSEFKEKIIYKISGNVESLEREKVRKEIEHKSGCVIVATYGVFSTGINIKKLHHVIFASFYKSKIKVMQSIGRGLRLHKSKKKLILWDIVDDFRYKTKKSLKENFAYIHFKQRLELYKRDQFDYVNKIVNIYNIKEK